MALRSLCSACLEVCLSSEFYFGRHTPSPQFYGLPLQLSGDVQDALLHYNSEDEKENRQEKPFYS